jgi:biotin carboxyl carrier protein
MKYTVTVAGRSFDIEVDHEQLVRVDGCPLYVYMEQVGGLPVYSLTLDDRGFVVFVEPGQRGYRVEVQGRVYPVTVENQRPRLASTKPKSMGGDELCLIVRAPLAGHLISLPVQVGEQVQAGEVLSVVESMKMKIELKAPGPGVVDTVNGPELREVSQGEMLVTLRNPR